MDKLYNMCIRPVFGILIGDYCVVDGGEAKTPVNEVDDMVPGDEATDAEEVKTPVNEIDDIPPLPTLEIKEQDTATAHSSHSSLNVHSSHSSIGTTNYMIKKFF